MKYLAYFKPSDEFLKIAQAYVESLGDNVSKNLIGSGHCTVMYAVLKEENESEIVRDFKIIAPAASRETKIKCLERFDEGSLVAKLDDTSGYLRRMHYSVIQTLSEFLDREYLQNTNLIPEKYRSDKSRMIEYKKWGSIYAGEHYNPHITLCRLKNNGKANLRKKPFRRIEWVTDKIFLAKRVSGEWADITNVELV